MNIRELLAKIPGATRELNVQFNDCELKVEMDASMLPVYASAVRWVGGMGTRIDAVGDAPNLEVAFDEYLKACGVAG